MPDSAPIPGWAPGVELLPSLTPYVRHCGDEPRGPWRIGTRRLLDYLLVYIAEGRGRFMVNGIEYDAEPDDLFWIPPDTDHAMEGFPPRMVCPYAHFDLVYRRTTSHWDFSIPAGMTDLSDFAPLRHPPLDAPPLAELCGRLRSPTNRRVGDALREICAEAARAQPYAVLRMSGLMLGIVAEILRGQGRGASGDAHVPLLEDAAEYLRKHAAEEPSLAEVAEIARLSPSHFRRLFGARFGCSPREYARKARVQAAKRLMIGTDMNVSEVARKLGFSTVHAFSRAFRDVEGIPPSRYRASGAVTTRVEGRRTPYSR